MCFAFAVLIPQSLSASEIRTIVSLSARVRSTFLSSLLTDCPIKPKKHDEKFSVKYGGGCKCRRFPALQRCYRRGMRDSWDTSRDGIEILEKLKDLKKWVCEEYRTAFPDISSGLCENSGCAGRTISASGCYLMKRNLGENLSEPLRFWKRSKRDGCTVACNREGIPTPLPCGWIGGGSLNPPENRCNCATAGRGKTLHGL
jgi:hypothetical protein